MALCFLGMWKGFFCTIHFHTKSGILDSGFLLLRHVQLSMLLEQCARVALTQGLELEPVCCELMCETLLRRDGARHRGLLVLGAGRHSGGNLCLLVCLMEVVKLREDEGAR